MALDGALDSGGSGAHVPSECQYTALASHRARAPPRTASFPFTVPCLPTVYWRCEYWRWLKADGAYIFAFVLAERRGEELVELRLKLADADPSIFPPVDNQSMQSVRTEDGDDDGRITHADDDTSVTFVVVRTRAKLAETAREQLTALSCSGLRLRARWPSDAAHAQSLRFAHTHFVPLGAVLPTQAPRFRGAGHACRASPCSACVPCTACIDHTR